MPVTTVGSVRAFSRFPVKSMLGERPASVDIDASGIVGDRAWGLVDVETGKVASAKHPRLWASLLSLQAEYVDAPGAGHDVRIRLGDGSVAYSTDADIDARLSEHAGRDVRLVPAVPPGAVYDEEWPDVGDIAPAEFIASTTTGESRDGHPLSSLAVGLLAPGTFQDVAPLTVMTTASLRAARALHPDGDWDDRRFRSAILVEAPGDGFVEQAWVGRRLMLGDTDDAVEIEVAAAIPRCVMVTLPQQGLGGDADVLRTLARHNRVDVMGLGAFACLGVYATVVRPGRVAVGAEVRLG